MYKKTVTCEDYNGVKYTEDFWFNLSEAELLDMELESSGTLADYAKKIINTQDYKGLIKLFRDLVLRAYGVKTADGKRFMKNDEIRASFVESPAYSKIFMELARDDVAAAEFINGITPGSIDTKKALEEAKAQGIMIPESANQ